MKTHLYLTLALGLLTMCGKKEAPDAGLPVATQNGANTGGCLINGERFVATGWGGGLLSNPIPPLSGGFAFDSLYWLQMAGTRGNDNVYLSLFLKRVGRTPPKLGIYHLDQNTQYYPQGGAEFVLNHATYRVSSAAVGETYVTNSQSNGQVNFNYADYGRGISAGTFEFTAASTLDRTKTVTITSGRFDRKQ